MHSIAIENDALKIQVWPGYGGKVGSIVDKADRFDLMFSYPRELPTTPHYDVDYAEGWYAGWDECLPGIAKGPYAGHPYEGVIVPDHGELWGLPTRVQPSSEGILIQWHGVRFGYHFSRHLRLCDNTLVASYELENLVPYDFHFVWTMHSLLNMTLPVDFKMQADPTWRLSHGSGGPQPNGSFTWPHMPDGVDISHPSETPPGGGWKVFSNQPIDKPFVIHYPTRGRQVKLEFSSDSGITAYWGIWVNSGGWLGHRHFAVEPTTGRFDHLRESIKDHSAAMVPPLSTVSWKVRWTVEPGE